MLFVILYIAILLNYLSIYSLLVFMYYNGRLTEYYLEKSQLMLNYSPHMHNNNDGHVTVM